MIITYWPIREVNYSFIVIRFCIAQRSLLVDKVRSETHVNIFISYLKKIDFALCKSWYFYAVFIANTVFENHQKYRIWILAFSSNISYTVFENQPISRIWILAFSTNFCPIQSDLSGNIVWPQASGFQKLAKIGHFWHFWLTFVHSKCKHSSLRSQY